MLKKILKALFGIAIIPLAVGATAALYRNLGRTAQFSGELHFFSWGIISYCIMHLLFYKPTFLYVLGHEAIHAVVAWLYGGKITAFQVSKDGGKVATDRSNLFINLSPYFIPIYTILLILFYYVLSSSYSIHSQTFIFLIGSSLAFHIVSTIEALKIRQPDIIKSGPVFSIILIYILNVVIIALILGLLFRDFTLRSYFGDFFKISRHIYAALLYQLFL